LKRRLRVFAELAADLTMLLDSNGKITFQSPSIQASLGLGARGEAWDGIVLELVVEQDRGARLAEAIRAALSGEDAGSPSQLPGARDLGHRRGNAPLWVSRAQSAGRRRAARPAA